MLTESSKIKLKSIKWALEKFFYSAGTNIAFYNASKNKKYRVFRQRCEKAILKQTEPFYEPKNVKAIQERIPAPLKKIDDTIIDTIVSALFYSFSSVFKGGAEAMDNFLIWAGTLGGQASFDKVGIDLTFKLYNPEVISRLRDRRNFLINSVDNTTKEWIARTIASGTEQGLSHNEIARNIRENSVEMSRNRAKKIVETEVANAMGTVELESIKRNGSEYKKWVTSRDEKVCPICDGNEKQGRIPINESFIMSKSLSTPGHPFCRCYLEGSIPPDIPIESIWTGN